MIRTIFLGIATLSVWAVLGLNDARAGTILQRPLYFGLTQGLVGYWSFDEQGTMAYDRSGQGNDGTLTNGPVRKIGKIGQAIALTNRSDHVVRDSFSTFPTSAITTAFWMRSSDTVNDGTPLSYSVGGNNEFLIFSYKGFAIYINDSSVSTGVSATDGVWHHITVTWRSSDGALQVYKDGASVYFGTLSAGAPISGGGCLVIGEEQDAACGSFQDTQAFVGEMDEVLIYDRILSPDEIKRLYNIGATTKFNVSKKQDPSLNQGLVGLWTFDAPDMAGVTSYDRSGQGNNGTLTNGPKKAIGKIGQALEFDGVNDWIDNITQPAIQISPNVFTVVGIISPSNQTSYFITPNSAGIDQWIGYDATNKRIEVRITEFADINNRSRYSTSGSVPIDSWTHWAVSINNKNIKIYINGVLNSEFNESIDIADWTGNWRIGQRGNSTNWYKGKLDDVRVYNRTLSPDEIKRLYNMGATTKFNVSKKQDPSLNQGLVGLWTFDAPDMAGVTAYDRSGNNNNGTLTNGPKKVIGKIGQGLEFDGSNDNVATPLEVGTLDAKTFAGWFYFQEDHDNPGYGWYSWRLMALEGSSFDSNKYSGLITAGLTIGMWQAYAGGTATFVASDVLESNKWTHVAGTVDKQSGYIRIYINGVLKSSSYSATMPSSTFFDPSGSINIGGGSGGFKFNGLIDEVRVYNRALSAAEVLRLYNLGK